MSLPVNNIQKYHHKSWKPTSNLKDVDFNRSNIIFGHNGAGKSSLAYGIAKDYLGSNDKESARFFSSKYVDSTLLLKDGTGIRGVVSSFGKKDVDIEKKIEKNDKRLKDISKEVAKTDSAAREVSKETDIFIKEVVKRRKDKNTKINNKSDSKTLPERVALWIKDYEDAHKLFPGEDYNGITGGADFSAESEQVGSITFPAMPDTDAILADDLDTILGEPYKSLDVPENDIVTWLQDGVHIHGDKSHCEFCGSEINLTNIKKRVDSYLNDEQHKATVRLEGYKKTLQDLSSVAKEIVDARTVYKATLLLKDNQVEFDDLSINIVQINAIIKETIDKKLGDMGAPLTLKAGLIDTIVSNINTALSTLRGLKQERAKEVTEKINRLETLVKGAIGLELKNSEVVSDNLGKITEADDKLTKLYEEQRELQRKNVLLEGRKSNLADFADYLNGVLEDLNLNFKLTLTGKVYVLNSTDGSPLKLDDISDGERNLLSLIYFYYEMLGHESGTIKDVIKLIIIDDPISSLDDSNKFYITEVVRGILDQDSVQVFVLTHSWNDFCNIAYGRTDDDKTSLFEVKKSEGVSNIHMIGSGKLLTPYMMLYREVDNFRKKNVAEIHDAEALHMPNTMRRILEEYIKFRVDVDFATASKNGDISKALFGDELINLSGTKKQKLNKLLAVCNIMSHKASQPKNPSEIHESAKFLIGSIEAHDKYHHLKMRGE